MHARIMTWWMILKISFSDRLVYRGDFIIGTLLRFLPVVTQILLWTSIFQASSRQDIGGFKRNEVISYYLLVLIARAFSSMPGLTSGITLQIRNGEIKKFLIQPIDLLGYLFLMRVAHKLVYYLFALVPFAIVFYLCRGYFSGWPSGLTVACFVLSLILGFMLGFFIEATLGLIGFWWLEVSSLVFLYMLLTFFLSGQMFPLDILPWGLKDVVTFLPMQYFAYFPAAVFLEKIQGAQLINALWIEAAWVIFFIITSRMAFVFGVKRYSGFGG